MQAENIHPHRTLAQAPLLALHEVVWCRQSPASQLAIGVHEEEELQFCEQLQQQQQLELAPDDNHKALYSVGGFW
jgi:hypothetical protein